MDAKQVNYSTEGVTVKIPAQTRNIGLRKLALPAKDSMKPTATGFQPNRLVINLALVDEANPNVYLTDFGQPVELRIRYTKPDLDFAKVAGKPLALAFWDGAKWIRFTKTKHNFTLVPDADPTKGGVGVVSLTKWGDPPVSWGK